MSSTTGSLEERLTSIVHEIHTGQRKPHILSFCVGKRPFRSLNIEFFKDTSFEKVQETISFNEILPTLLTNSSTIRRAKKQGEAECSICLDQYRCRERLRHLPCGHEFHAKCYDRWCRQDMSLNCPTCRARFNIMSVMPLVKAISRSEDHIMNTKRCVASIELRCLDPREKQRPYQADLDEFIRDRLTPAPSKEDDGPSAARR